MKTLDFAYSVALVRTLETLLLGDNEVERMMLAKDATEAFKILNEFDYADNKGEITDPSDFQRVLDEGLMDIKTTLSKSIGGHRVLNMLWLQYDFHNMKTLLKAKLSGQTYEEVEELLNKLGAIPLKALKDFIMDDQNATFGLSDHTEKYIKKKIRKVQELFEKSENNPQVIDLYMDQKLMKVLFGIATDMNNEFLIEYLRRYIDVTNIRLFFRMKSQDKPQSLFEIAFLWNGKLPYMKFEKAYGHKLSDFVEMMKSSDYSKLVETGTQHYEKEKTFVYLEKEIENYLTDFIKRAKLIPFGPEPLIAYYLAKKNNALVIRMIMVSKLNGVDPEEIRSRLRKLYS